ncbi:uncharacterized protein EDB93DRAFT_1134175 [Suillus bovinus]|uniref:uncharacterized protein n=1 Tax=Suillus bovinus TaxID=48563 RepID=UPI001B87B57E|nr:uncharacterized protein EDB93DRAFT_1134175 [Suillus bovinus]KAG2153695.1 hypothetical protein EDB93DRAFT_1134175 [Suillus bovinus]
MQRPGPATVMMLDCITDDDVGRKLRVAGRMLTYDPSTALVLLSFSSHGLLVDVSLVIDPDAVFSTVKWGGTLDSNVDCNWMHERKAWVWVMGWLERSEQDLPIPEPPPYTSPPDVDPSIVLKALNVTSARDLDVVGLRTALAVMGEVQPTTYPE